MLVLSRSSRENQQLVVGDEDKQFVGHTVFSTRMPVETKRRTNQLTQRRSVGFTFVGQGFIVLGQGSFILGQGFMILEQRWDGGVDFMIMERVFMSLKRCFNILKQTVCFCDECILELLSIFKIRGYF